MSKILFSILIYLLIIACKHNVYNIVANHTIAAQHIDTVINGNKIKATDYAFFSDSILHGREEVLKHYFAKYANDNCNTLEYTKKEIRNFQGFYKLGNIHKQITTYVFVLNPLNNCMFDNEKGTGQAYYFTDTTLPRLQTDSYCCDPSNIFLVGDIDEDGVSEIGEYYSSCSSHYKSLIVYSLKNNQWKEIANSVYDMNYMK